MGRRARYRKEVYEGVKDNPCVEFGVVRMRMAAAASSSVQKGGVRGRQRRRIR
jgi:hypothetical protein